MLTITRQELEAGMKVSQMREENSDLISRIYKFIVAYKTAHNGNSPSYRQIATAVRLPTTNGIAGYLRQLSRMGLIRREAGSRGLIVVGSEWVGPGGGER